MKNNGSMKVAVLVVLALVLVGAGSYVAGTRRFLKPAQEEIKIKEMGKLNNSSSGVVEWRELVVGVIRRQARPSFDIAYDFNVHLTQNMPETVRQTFVKEYGPQADKITDLTLYSNNTDVLWQLERNVGKEVAIRGNLIGGVSEILVFQVGSVEVVD